MDKIVKRRRSKYNPYLLEKNHTVTFIDSKGTKQSMILDDKVYQAFNKFELQDLKEMNEYDRHIEHVEQTEASLYHHTKSKYISVEDMVFHNILLERLQQEIDKLSSIQRRRLKMYYFEGKTLQEIANIEVCSKIAIKYSIDYAIKKIYKNLKM